MPTRTSPMRSGSGRSTSWCTAARACARTPSTSGWSPMTQGVLRVPDRAIAHRHRLNIGTIVSDASITVQLKRGKRLGHVEEAFISRLTPGDCFVFAGRVLEFIRVREMTAWVKPAPARSAVVPRWAGYKMSFSTQLAAETRALIGEARRGIYASPELERCGPLLRLQARWSALPDEREWLIEQIATRDGHYLCFYPFEGRLVHLGLATLFSYRLARGVARSFSITCTDYGFALLSPAASAAVARGAWPAARCARRRARYPRRAQRIRARPPPVPRNRARRGTDLPGLPGPGQDGAPAAGVERPHLRRVHRIRSAESPAATGVCARFSSGSWRHRACNSRSRACGVRRRC